MPLLTDDEAATLAIASIIAPTPAQQTAHDVITSILSSPDPFIDPPLLTSTLFRAYDTLYFRSSLTTTTAVVWSTRMTLCAGLCELLTDSATRRPLSPRQCRVKLSEPLLKFRPRADVLNTLLHELVHAYLFICGGSHVRGDDPSGHGSGFQRLAKAISKHGGYEITTFHAFHDEVESYRTHVWRCDGPCRALPPYFGLVKRAMNRAPGPGDAWYARHEMECGGAWTKIMEPEKKEKGKRGQKNKIDVWIVKGDKKQEQEEEKENGEGSSQKSKKQKRPLSRVETKGISDAKKKKKETQPIDLTQDDDDLPQVVAVGEPTKDELVECPVCFEALPENTINSHLDTAHGF